MDLLTDTSKKINKLYDELHYFDLYGGSVFLFFIFCIVLFLVVSYTSVMINIQPIKDDWVAQRCSPKVMPFAGFINKPDGSTVIDFTQDNFTYCIQSILTSITGYAVEPITIITSAITELYNEIADTINSIRSMVSNVRTYISDIAQEILGRIANIMIPLQRIVIAFRDSMSKVKGIMAAGLYTSLGTYYTLKSLLGAIMEIIIIILIAAVVVLVCLWLLPFTWPVAITGSALFLAISIPLAIILAFMSNTLHISTSMSIPSVPSCFDKNTKIKMMDGTYKRISEIERNDVLWNSVKVTATMVLDASLEDMYDLDGVVVSGNHRVFHEGRWIYVREHIHGKLVENYREPLIYCLNTDSKRIEIEGTVFCDWDEIFEEELEVIRKNTGLKDLNYSNMNSVLDRGLPKGTLISLMNGDVHSIEDIKVGDILENRCILENNRVYGIVEVFTGGGGAGLEKLYHLLTESKYFYIHGKTEACNHYNACVEFYLN